MKRTVIGILAHVDAGKTTLSEAMLYLSGARSKLGRVDRGDSLLDNHTIERERGITVFSKLAELTVGDTEVTLIDTPGHIDFSCEAERSLSVQDYAILVVSATDGVTSHTETLFELLRARGIPTFIFLNKMDIAERRRIDIMAELRRAFGTGAVDFGLLGELPDKFFEECAAADEGLMEDYFENGTIGEARISHSIKSRRILPVVFGSAQKCEGVSTLLSVIDRFTVEKKYSKNILGARVYKIMTAPDGARLTYLKLTGGEVVTKDTVRYIGTDGEEHLEKVEAIRVYSADKFRTLKRAEAGGIYAFVGLSCTRAGSGIGVEADDSLTLEPVLDYKMQFESGVDIHEAYMKIAKLGEEDPSLSLRYDRDSEDIRVKLMGEIQTEVLTRMILDRFGYRVTFGEGTIIYRETIAEKTYGAGHFEPLMHYAEVRLSLEPLPRGTGLIFTSNCPSDRLKTNWQRLILSHLEERAHRGTLTGSPITDMKITLIAGRAHPKHTEGGDFREATFRALRQGLMKAKSILLEPIFSFDITVPENFVGRVMTDVSNMYGECEPPEFLSGKARLVGYAPVKTIRSYPMELRAFTHGEGTVTLTLSHYAECHDEEDTVAQIGYSPELDMTVTPDSVFCKKGAGYQVPWYEADSLMHTENPEDRGEDEGGTQKRRGGSRSSYRGTAEEDRELMRIFESTYGKIKPRTLAEKTENSAGVSPTPKKPPKQKPKGDDYVIVDGYNLIFAWDKLNALAKSELGHARDTLIHILSNYRAFKKCKVILVFDAYRRKDSFGSDEEIGGISVIYTKERQTADAYIERCAYSLADKNSVSVVTSDYDEQLVVLGVGAIRIPSAEFIREVESVTDLSKYE